MIRQPAYLIALAVGQEAEIVAEQPVSNTLYVFVQWPVPGYPSATLLLFAVEKDPELVRLRLVSVGGSPCYRGPKVPRSQLFPCVSLSGSGTSHCDDEARKRGARANQGLTQHAADGNSSQGGERVGQSSRNSEGTSHHQTLSFAAAEHLSTEKHQVAASQCSALRCRIYGLGVGAFVSLISKLTSAKC